jgi:acetyl-CoA acetyltransferase
MAVYLSRPVKQFSGSRQSLEYLALEGFEALLASGGPPPELLLITTAHPFELAATTGTDVAYALTRRAHELGLSMQVEFYANPGTSEPTAHLAASAAGAALVHEGARRVARGEVKRLAVLGVEQMRLTEREATTQALRGLIHPEERSTGLTMPALGALLTRRFEAEYPGLPQALTALTIANRSRTVANPRAHMRKSIRLEEISGDRNPIVSDPLRLFDVAPTSSGYAGLFLSGEPGPHATQVVVAGIGRGLDLLSVARRFLSVNGSSRLPGSAATREAMNELLTGLGWSPAEFQRRVSYAEIHDAFPIIEFLSLLDSGLAAPETIVNDILSGAFDRGGRLPVNVMGGVMGGHPIAATGVGQIVELYLQAMGRSETKVAGPDLHYAFALNVGGPLTYNCVTLLCACPSRGGRAPEFRLSERSHATVADLDTGMGPALVAGPARILSGTRLEFPPPGYPTPCHIALVTSPGATQFVACLGEPPPPGSLAHLVQTNGHLSALVT